MVSALKAFVATRLKFRKMKGAYLVELVEVDVSDCTSNATCDYPAEVAYEIR